MKLEVNVRANQVEWLSRHYCISKLSSLVSLIVEERYYDCMEDVKKRGNLKDCPKCKEKSLDYYYTDAGDILTFCPCGYHGVGPDKEREKSIKSTIDKMGLMRKSPQKSQGTSSSSHHRKNAQ